MITVGGREVEPDLARGWVEQYLNGERGQYGYPSYDGYVTNNDPNRLCDGDLLAPVLLNVQVKLRSFADLCACRGDLESALANVAVDLDLTEADDAAVARVGALFAVLDSPNRPRNVQGTTLAKVLHRKRPNLVPLFDEQVRRVYQDGENAPIPPVKGRSWVEFMTLLADRMRQDLTSQREVWNSLTRLGPDGGPYVSRLRALDIVAWRLGSGEPSSISV